VIGKPIRARPRHGGRPYSGTPPGSGSIDQDGAFKPRSVPPVDQCPTEIFRSCRALSRGPAALSCTLQLLEPEKPREARLFRAASRDVKKQRKQYVRLAGGLGFEPGLAELESAVVDIHR